jgi:hypothetical protein
MKSKSKINGFKPFTGYDDVSDGLKIPTGKTVEPSPSEFKQSTAKQPNQLLGNIVLENRAFTPMTNVVPTINPVNVPTQNPKLKGLTRKQRQRIVPEDLNVNEYGALATNKERIAYLALHGWAIRPQRRGNGLFYYATRYVNRKKKTFYVCTVGNYGQ